MFDLLQLKQFLSPFMDAPCFWIAYSGGLDSHVLLHALASLLPKEKLCAVHINHGWSKNAAQWSQHCRQVCNQLAVNYRTIKIQAQPQPGESLEACARQARYAACAELVKEQHCLLTAHQKNDQAETLLLQLFRGAGLQGLASMPMMTRFAEGYHLRPLLLVSRAELQQYAEQQQLRWIEDESNTDTRFNRNFIRHRLLPQIQQRWPQVIETVARSATHCAEAKTLLEQKTKDDFMRARGSHPGTLSVKALLGLTEPQLNYVLRYWLQLSNLRMPSQAQLMSIKKNILQNKQHTTSQIQLSQFGIRRYRDNLFWLPKRAQTEVLLQSFTWNLTQPMKLSGIGIFFAKKQRGEGIRCAALTDNEVMLRFRQQGERFHPTGRQGSHPLKKLFQEWGIPPWERSFIPLLWHKTHLIAVIGYGIAENFSAGPEELGWVISVEPEIA